MKRIIILILIFFPLLGITQTKSINHFYNQYKYADDVVNFSIPGWLVRFGAKFVDDYPIRHTLKKIRKAKFMVIDDGQIVDDRDFNDMLSGIEEENYELLIQVLDGDTEVLLYGLDKGYFLSHLFFVTKDKDELVLISLKGEFNEDDIELVANEVYKDSN